jgi:hypothetical protein
MSKIMMLLWFSCAPQAVDLMLSPTAGSVTRKPCELSMSQRLTVFTLLQGQLAASTHKVLMETHCTMLTLVKPSYRPSDLKAHVTFMDQKSIYWPIVLALAIRADISLLLVLKAFRLLSEKCRQLIRCVSCRNV